MSRRTTAGSLLATALASAPIAAQETSACWAEVLLDPPRAVVGEQVLYRVRIFSRDEVDSVEWSHPPAFPNLRTETLPGDPQPVPSSELRVRDERRALFAERPGAHRLLAPELRCSSRSGVEIAPVPEVVLPIDPLPDAGRPGDFAGPVGPVSLHVTVSPQELTIGESLRVAVMVRGGGNLWVVTDLFAPGAFGSAEVFGGRAELVLERGRSLFLRRHFAYDVVPRETGELDVPAIPLPYYDPATGSYRVARSEPVRVTVRTRAEASAPAARRPSDRAAPAAGDAPDPRRRLPWLLAPLLLLAGVPLWLRWRGGRADATRAALSEAAALEASGDRDGLAAALAHALRTALEAHFDDARAVAPEELMARKGLSAPVSAAAHLLASLERARFDPEAPPPDARAVRRAIADL